MINLEILKNCLAGDVRVNKIPKRLLNSMLKLEFKADSCFPVPINVIKWNDKYEINASGIEFHLEPYDIRFHRNATKTEFGDNKMQATPYLIENFELGKFCTQYINSSANPDIAAKIVLEAQYYILDHIYKHRENGSYEHDTSYLYPLYKQRVHLLMYRGISDELRFKLFEDACWLFDEFDRLEAEWTNHNASIYDEFIY